ncbi:AIP1 [Acrasis kona]|uniref:AIP1 n=1 Tax=Acrasis kona TaxID=1008807 RepID=A0AAW2YN63_9EUKA
MLVPNITHAVVLKGQIVYVWNTSTESLELSVELPRPSGGTIFRGNRLISLNDTMVIVTDYLGNHHFFDILQGRVLSTVPCVGDIIKLDDDSLVTVTLERLHLNEEGFTSWKFFRVNVDLSNYDITLSPLSSIDVKSYNELVTHACGGDGYLLHTYDNPPETIVHNIHTGEHVMNIKEPVNNDQVVFFHDMVSYHDGSHWVGNRNTVITRSLKTGDIISKVYLQEKKDVLFLNNDFIGLDHGNSMDIFDLKRGRLLFNIKSLEGHPKAKRGDYIITRNGKSEMELWDMKTRQKMCKIGEGEHATFLPGRLDTTT